MLPFFSTSKRRQWYKQRREIVSVCSFQDESQWILYSYAGVSRRFLGDEGRTRGSVSKGEADDIKVTTLTPAGQQVSPFTSISITNLLQTASTLPRGILWHSINAVLATIILVWFLLVPQTHDSTTTTIGLYCIYLSQLGLIYDNAVNVVGPYMGDNSVGLRLLHKFRFVWHVTSMPLLGIPVTELAMRYYYPQAEESSSAAPEWICWLLYTWSLVDFIKWNVYCDSNHLTTVDLRSSDKHKGNHLSGTLSYTCAPEALWEMALPPILLVLYELVVGIQGLLVLNVGFACATVDDSSFAAAAPMKVILASSSSSSWPLFEEDTTTASTLLLCGESDGGSSTTIFTSAMWLSLCGMLTLVSCGMASRYPELQLLGELLHGVLLWSAYVTASASSL